MIDTAGSIPSLNDIKNGIKNGYKKVANWVNNNIIQPVQKGATKVLETAKDVGSVCVAAFESLDVFAGVGMGFSGKKTVVDYFEISGGIAYDEIGVRFNEGKLSFSQRFFQGFGLTTFFPMFENSDETYRNYTFSSALPVFPKGMIIIYAYMIAVSI